MALSLNGVTITGKTSLGPATLPGYRYFRLNITGSVGLYIRFQAVKIMVSSTAYPFAIGNMTSNTLPTPLVASASSIYDSPFEAWRAFANEAGGNDTYRWISASSAPQWLQVDLGSGNNIIPTSLQLCADSDAAASYVTDFQLLGSNIGSFTGEQATLYTSATLTGVNWTANTFTTFTF